MFQRTGKLVNGRRGKNHHRERNLNVYDKVPIERARIHIRKERMNSEGRVLTVK